MKRIADQSLYEILDVRDDASAEEISAACDRARALYGPGSLATYTLMSSEEAALLTSRIEEARATLLDAGARARYDESLHRREPRAVTGTGGAAALPPVIPAAPRPEAPRALEPGVPVEPARTPAPLAAPPVLLTAPAGPPAADEPPAPRPILLDRAIPEPADDGAVAGAAAPAAMTPVPASAPAASSPPAAAPLPASAPAPLVPEGATWSGDVLRQFREARGISVQQIAERTKVTRYHIENIEAERFGQLPAPVYLRGILLSLARELRLDGQKVARSYLERASAAKGR